MRSLLAALLVMVCGCMTDAFAAGHPKSQVTFRVRDTNVMLLVKSSVLSYAGRRSNGKLVTLFWSGSVKKNGAVILHEPSSSHPYAVILQGPPGSRPELSVEFEGRDIYRDTLHVQPIIPKNGTVEIHLWFKIPRDLAMIVLDPSSHWMPPPRPEDPRVQRVRSGAKKGRFVLLWKQPRFLGMTNDVAFDVRWSTGTVSKARWEDERRILDLNGLDSGQHCSMDVSSFVSAGARSFAIRVLDSRGHDSLVSEPALVDSDDDTIPDVWEIEFFGDLSKDATRDTDKDHAPDFVEFRLGLDPNNPDSDGDGLPDGFEMGGINRFDPKKPDSDIDSDGDGFSNLEEYKAGTDIWNSSIRPDGKGFGRREKVAP